MKRVYFSGNALQWAVLCGLLCAIAVSFARFEAACDDLRANVLRLHIIANSDSAADQAVKLAVRDRILEETGDLFEGQSDLEGAQAAVCRNLASIEETARQTLRENGFDYNVSAEIGNSFFETREYDTFTLPAGTYRSLIIRLGKAEGKNWWCVVFPAICLPAASDASLSDCVEPSSAAVAEHPSRYVVRFKTVELYEDFKKIFQR